MTLDDWRQANALNYQQLADRLGVNHESASRYCKGRRIPAAAVMRRIVQATGGQVQPNDFYQLPQEARSAAGATGKDHRLSPDALVTSKGDPT
jgi:transcriptional regulator with XRE-family HTH domain